jgi:hypothetical protein
MQKETLVSKYLRLSKDLEVRLNADIQRLTGEMNKQIEIAIQKKLNAMESALKVGALTEAAIYKMEAEILLNSML